MATVKPELARFFPDHLDITSVREEAVIEVINLHLNKYHHFLNFVGKSQSSNVIANYSLTPEMLTQMEARGFVIKRNQESPAKHILSLEVGCSGERFCTWELDSSGVKVQLKWSLRPFRMDRCGSGVYLHLEPVPSAAGVGPVFTRPADQLLLQGLHNFRGTSSSLLVNEIMGKQAQEIFRSFESLGLEDLLPLREVHEMFSNKAQNPETLRTLMYRAPEWFMFRGPEWFALGPDSRDESQYNLWVPESSVPRTMQALTSHLQSVWADMQPKSW